MDYCIPNYKNCKVICKCGKKLNLAWRHILMVKVSYKIFKRFKKFCVNVFTNRAHLN